MSDAKYISVIHKETQKLVTAFKFENDATWIGREKEKLIATPVYCNEGEEVEMIFVKSFSKANDKIVHAYFRSMPNQPKLKSNMNGESYGHKKAKENVYAGIYSGEIKIDNVPLNKTLVKDILLEYRTVGEEYVITDVMVLLKEFHPKYGLGLFFEIQLSKQHDDETIERHYSRVIEGFSGVWFTKEDFTSNWKLKYDNIEIKSHRKLLSELEEYKENNFIKRINNYGEVIDAKLNLFEDNINKVVKQSKNSIKKYSENEINLIDINNSKLEELKNIADNINIYSVKETCQNVLSEFENSIPPIIERCRGRVTNIIEEELKNITVNSFVKQKCPLCNKGMKIGKANGGYNVFWYCEDYPYCNGKVRIKNKEDVVEE